MPVTTFIRSQCMVAEYSVRGMRFGISRLSAAQPSAYDIFFTPNLKITTEISAKPPCGAEDTEISEKRHALRASVVQAVVVGSVRLAKRGSRTQTINSALPARASATATANAL